MLKLVNLVTEKLIDEKKYPHPREFPLKLPSKNENPTDNRSKVITELLETERKYIESLEELMVSCRN